MLGGSLMRSRCYPMLSGGPSLAYFSLSWRFNGWCYLLCAEEASW
jgi:hypothetical protein